MLTASGAAVFHDGGGIHPAHTVNLGSTGSVQVQLDSTGPGAVNVTATIQTATMVQADNGGNQDFVYLDFTPNTKSVVITFKDCKDLKVTKTAVPTVDQAYSWTIKKTVVGADTKTADAGSSVGFDYKVDVTKSAPVDSNWKVTGTISVTNPNAFDVTGTVVDDVLVEPTDTCMIVGGATQLFPAGKTTPVAYTCTFSEQAVLRPAHELRERDVADAGHACPDGRQGRGRVLVRLGRCRRRRRTTASTCTTCSTARPLRARCSVTRRPARATACTRTSSCPQACPAA